jgi:acyl carrier protein
MEVKNIILEMFKERYNIDLSGFPDDYKTVDLENLNPQLDSVEVTNFIFDVEDRFNIRLDVDEGLPETLGQFYKMFEDVLDGKDIQ